MCLKSVGKDSVDTLMDYVVPRIENLTYNVTDTIYDLINDTTKEMIPTLQNLTYMFLIVITVLAFPFFVGLIIVVIILL